MTFASRPVRAALLGACLVALAAAPARAQGVSWLTDYNAARREAHDRNLPLVIDFSTENCVWCRKLEATTFRDPAVVKLLGERFVALHVHVDAAGGKEAALAQRLNITGYPTLVFADPEGNIVARHDGYMDAAEFGKQMQTILASAAPADAGVRQAVNLTAAPADVASPDRARRAGQLLTLAQAEYGGQHFLACLERCQVIKADYAGMPEAVEAQRLETSIRSDPDELRAACDNMTDRLGEMYLDLAEAYLRKQQPARAALCLEWVLQACPGTPQAEAAKGRLAQIKKPAAQQTDH